MIEAKKITKKYGNKTVLDNFSITINDGEFVSVIGESGSGKSTLINVLGLLESITAGDIIIENIKNPDKKASMLLMRNSFGYVFQNYALIENETVENNLKIALEYRKVKSRSQEIRDALEFVNLRGFEKRKVYELSGGEQQRIAIARVCVKECRYIFADEPTGNLDKKNREIVYDLLKSLSNQGKSIICVTHDTDLASKADKVVEIQSL